MYKLRVSCGVRFHLMFLTFTSAFLKSSCFVFGGLVLDACWSSSSYICTKSAILPATTRYCMILPLLLLFTPCLRIMFVPQSVCPAPGGLNVENTFAVYVQFLQDLFGLLQRTKKQKTRPFLMANYLGPSMLHQLGSLDWRRMTNTLGVKFAKCQAQKCKMNQNASSKMPTCTAFHTAMCNA